MPITPNAPCHERWSQLSPTGDGPTSGGAEKYCQKCDKTVVDMTALTRRQAEKLLVQAGGELCGRLRVDPSGAPVFRREGQRAPSLLGLATASLLAACGSTTEESGSSTSVAASVEARSPEVTTGGDHLLSSDGVGGSLARPMMPLADDRPATSSTATEAEAIVPTIASLAPSGVETDADVVPTADQLLLTERKEEDRHPVRHGGRRRVRTVPTVDAVDPPDTSTTARRRNNGSHTVSVAPTTPGAPSINTPPPEMYLGGISYTP